MKRENGTKPESSVYVCLINLGHSALLSTHTKYVYGIIMNLRSDIARFGKLYCVSALGLSHRH